MTQLPFSRDVAAGKRSGIDRHHRVSARILGQRKHRGQTRALRPGKACPLLGAVGIGEDRSLVVRGERALNRAERLIDLRHDVRGQGLIDDKSNRKGLRIDAEHPQRLACVVFVDREVPPGEAGDQVPLGVLHRDRNLNKIHLDDKAGQCPAAGFGRAACASAWAGRRAAGSKAEGGCSGWGWPVAEEEFGPGRCSRRANSGGDRPVDASERRGWLRSGSVGNRLLFLGQCPPAQDESRAQKRCQRNGPSTRSRRFDPPQACSTQPRRAANQATPDRVSDACQRP